MTIHYQNLSKFQSQKVKKFVYSTIFIFFIFILGWIILENILYQSTFPVKKQIENIYSKYESLFYTVNKKKVDVVYRDRGNRDIFVYFHGNTGRLNYILDYLNEHTSFVAPAYPGYHRSQGKPGVNDTLEIINKFLPQIEKIFGQNIRLHIIGHSLGSQISSFFAQILLASDDSRFKTLSLVASFSSIRQQCNNVMGVFYLFCTIANKSFNADNYLKIFKDYPIMNMPYPKIQIKVYHLPLDSTIPYHDGRKFYDGIFFPEGSNLDAGKQFINFFSGSHSDFDISLVVRNALK